MRRPTWGTALVATAIFTLGAQTQQAGAAPALAGTCGGQNWHAVAPGTCSKTKTIDGTKVTIHLSMTATGFTAIVYTLDHPLPYATLIHATSHVGNSDSGGATADSGVRYIPAGGTTGALVIRQARCGQIDIRWKYDSPRGRVSGPYINNASCAVSPPTTTTSTSVPPTTPPGQGSSTTSSVPPSSPPSTSGTSLSTVPPGPSPLPPTGGSLSGALIGAVFTAAGAALTLLAGLSRRRAIRLGN